MQCEKLSEKGRRSLRTLDEEWEEVGPKRACGMVQIEGGSGGTKEQAERVQTRAEYAQCNIEGSGSSAGSLQGY